MELTAPLPQAGVKRRKLSEMQMLDLLVLLTVLLVTFRGFIDNFIGYGTLLVDVCFAVLLGWSIFAVVTGRVGRSRNRTILYFYLLWIVLCVLLAFLQWISGQTSFYDAVLGLRNNNIYTLLFFVVTLRMDRQGIKPLYRLFIDCGVLICAFAIVQFLLRNVLPESLLVLNGEDIFRLQESDIIRVTGLMGNTIIFGGYAIVLFALVWAQLLTLKFRSVLLWGKLIIIAVANAFTFSRASVAGMVMIAFVQFILYGCTHRRTWEYLASAAAAVCVLAVVVVVFFWDSTIIQRLFNLNSIWNEGSDEGHFQMIRDAIGVIGEHWAIGTMMGASNTVVADGVFWAYLLEWGVPVFLVYAVLFLWIGKIALRKCSSENRLTATLANGFLGMSLYMVCFSFINSAYGARSVLVFFWMVGGMLLATDNHKKLIPVADGDIERLPAPSEKTGDVRAVQTRIPKIIHACWLGTKEMPQDQKAYVEGWKRLHPDWEVIVWTDEMFAEYLGDSAFVRACLEQKKYGFLSDYFRFTVLYRFGGVYIDTDVELLKPLDGFLDCRMFMGFIFDSAIGTALIGSEKGNPLMLEWRDQLESDFEAKGDFTVSNDWITGYFLDHFSDFRLNGKRQSLACGIELYPKDWFERYQINKKSGGGYAEHHCAGSWKDGKEHGWKDLVRKLLPRGLVSWLGHRQFLKQTPYYEVYLKHRKL